MANEELKVPKRILNNLLKALGAGVVPREGAPYIAIGRQEEIHAILQDIDHMKEGGSACRFLVGRYGSGKSFLIQLLRGYALDENFLTADCDLSPERRLSGGSGAGLATYKELLRNLASKTSPDGGALSGILSRYYVLMGQKLVEDGFVMDTEEYIVELKKRVLCSLSQLEENVGGFDFARVLSEYYAATIRDDETKKMACLRWLRGEYATKTEAKNELSFTISTIINDDNWYDFLKLFSRLAILLGYNGLLVFIDECVNLYKIPNRIARESNYEKILSIFNDTLQGKAPGFGIIFGGTPQFLEDTRRGLFSYEALKSRLSDSRFNEMGYSTFMSPVIRLRRLSNNELLALLSRLTKLHASFYQTKEALTMEEMQTFLENQLERAGAEELITPREMIRDYLSILNILLENPGTSIDTLMQSKKEETKPEDDTPVKKEITMKDLDF